MNSYFARLLLLGTFFFLPLSQISLASDEKLTWNDAMDEEAYDFFNEVLANMSLDPETVQKILTSKMQNGKIMIIETGYRKGKGPFPLRLPEIKRRVVDPFVLLDEDLEGIEDPSGIPFNYLGTEYGKKFRIFWPLYQYPFSSDSPFAGYKLVAKQTSYSVRWLGTEVGFDFYLKRI